MSASTTCPKCGINLPANAPSGVCPRCLLMAGMPGNQLSQESVPTAAAQGRFVPASPETLAESFPQLEIHELLGQGGMGAVYRARQANLDREVAIKILPPEFGSDPAFAERFSREARALAKLSHQNIVSVFDFGQANGQYYFVMEFVDGANLRQLMEDGNMSPDEALSIVRQLCEALQFAHKEGVVHRDIKPENILVDKNGRVKIADFGLAKLLGNPPGDVSLTATQQVMGTLRYMAPEQMEGTRDVDHRADIFSLGVIFYELLTGELPIGRFDPPSHKSQVDSRLDEVVLRALEKEPARRYQQASEVNVDIDSIAQGIAPRPPLKAHSYQGLPGTPPRFSRMAIVGAIWAVFFFVLIPLTLMTFTTSSMDNNAVENAPAVPTRLLAIISLPIVLVGITAPFATTILGLVSVSQIRHSGGQLIGLPLALADALLFPLLLLDVLLIFVCFLPTFFLPDAVVVSDSEPALTGIEFSPLMYVGLAILGLVLCAVVDFLIVRWSWRKVQGVPTA